MSYEDEDEDSWDSYLVSIKYPEKIKAAGIQLCKLDKKRILKNTTNPTHAILETNLESQASIVKKFIEKVISLDVDSEKKIAI